ncbi:MAG: hypothetical protein ACOYEH_00130 [Caldicoprobacterales bacterium]|nr:hypothetical protein [Clostridiales bacterium]
MIVEKKKLGDIPRCYAVSAIEVNGEQQLVFAGEGEGGPCYAYSGEDFDTCTAIWERGGGTMSFVPVPGRQNEFLATQNFFPGFKAETSRVVWGKFADGHWVVRDYITIPYLHRFDLLEADGITYFLGATLCSFKAEREDWRYPGKVYAGILPGDWDEPMEVVPLKEGLYKNHGYFRGAWEGLPAGYVAAENGVWVFSVPKSPGSSWGLIRLMDQPVSDIAVFDLDGDGEDEYALLHPFHGDSFDIVKKRGSEFETVYSYPKTPEFSHAVWAGMLNGHPALIGGYRRGAAELFIVRFNQRNGSFETQVLDAGVGPTNVSVLHRPQGDIIAAANNRMHEAAIYYIY